MSSADGSIRIRVDADTKDAERAIDGLSRGPVEKLKSALAATAKITAAAIGAASAAVGVLSTQSLDAYSEYEQLTGSVETLFKDSAGAVQEYADNAFMTAGLSANEYMETVTSFSASLLQSLGGDTDKAASVADMAITDMADNANKMGTSMESIQNAYQGFAKQNYTMLDNLKLGYGGTQEEMERLLADAEALSGVHYDISSFADISEAIHVVQTELGITDTTALKASKTISGSAGSVKAAWKNLVAGLGNENANLETLLGNVVNSLTTATHNIAPRIEQILYGISNAVQSLAPMITDQLPALVSSLLPPLLEAAGQLVSGILSALVAVAPTFANLATQIVLMIAQTFVEALPGISSIAQTLILSIANGISSSLPELIPAVVGVISQIVESLADNVGEIVSAALALMEGLAQGLLDAIPVLIDAIPQIIDSLINEIVGAIPEIIQTGIKLLTALVEALPKIIEAIVAAIPKIINSIIEAIINSIPQIIEAGVALLIALVQNLPLIINTIVQAIPEIVSAILNAIVDNIPQIIVAGFQFFVALIENLPTIIIEIVKAVPQIVAGIIEAFDRLIGDIIDVGVRLVEGVWQGISNAASWFWNQVSGFFSGIVNGVKSFLGIASPSKVFAEIGGNMGKGLAVGIDGSSGTVQNAVHGLADAATGAFDPGIADYMSEEIESTGKVSKEELSNLHKEIKYQLSSMMEDLRQTFTYEMPSVGTSFAQGLAVGIQNGLSSVVNSAVNVARAAVAATKQELQIHSPSKVFEEIGGYTMQGLAEGITDKTRLATNSIAAAAKSVERAGKFGASIPYIPALASGYVMPTNRDFISAVMGQNQRTTNSSSLIGQPSELSGGDIVIPLVVKIGEENLINTVIRGIRNKSRTGGVDVLLG